MSEPGLRTPSLRTRVIGAGMITWLALVVLLDVFVFLSLRNQLLAALDDLLVARQQLVAEIGPGLGPDELDRLLTERGIPAIVFAPDGTQTTADPDLPGSAPVPPISPTVPAPVVTRMVELPGGTNVLVMASRSGVDRTLSQVLLLEVIGSTTVLVIMLLLLVRLSKVLLDPIDQVVSTARRIAAGRTGERLRPDRPQTELGRLAVALDEMLDALEDAIARAQAGADEARAAELRTRRFLADAAHQLRTPVAALRASVESLLRTDDTSERDHLLDILAAETSRVGRLVASLLRMAELDRGVEPVGEPVDLTELVVAEAARCRDLAPSLVVAVELSPRHDTVMGHSDGLREALANLMDNARRHARTRIDVVVAGDDGEVIVTVADDGSGLEAGSEELVFERFVSLDGRGGSGLGLPIARGVARTHGGDVRYRDGAFVLVLPRSPHPAPTTVG